MLEEMIDALDCMNLLRAAEPVAEKREVLLAIDMAVQGPVQGQDRAAYFAEAVRYVQGEEVAPARQLRGHIFPFVLKYMNFRTVGTMSEV